MRKSSSIHCFLALGMMASAGAARATDLGVSPNISLSPTMQASTPALQGNWMIQCTIQDSDTTYGWAGIDLYYSVTVGSENELKIPNLIGALGTESGSTTSSGTLLMQGDVGGSRLRPKFGGVFCHHDQQNSPLVDVWGEDLIVPPQISVTYAYNPDRTNDTPSVISPVAIDVVPNVPVGQPLVMVLDINAHPQGTETIELHYAGAGVQFTQVLHNITTDYQPPLEKVTPTAVGSNFSVWAVFQPYGSQSNTLQFHVVRTPTRARRAAAAARRARRRRAGRARGPAGLRRA